MGQHYLIDTNTVSNYLSELFRDKILDFLDTVTDKTPNISVITQIELLSWKTSDEVEDVVKNFLSDSYIFGLTPEIVEATVI